VGGEGGGAYSYGTGSQLLKRGGKVLAFKASRLWYSWSYTEETSCIKTVVCNKFHANSFLLINAQGTQNWLPQS
jgi:hypothetical protein